MENENRKELTPDQELDAPIGAEEMGDQDPLSLLLWEGEDGGAEQPPQGVEQPPQGAEQPPQGAEQLPEAVAPPQATALEALAEEATALQAIYPAFDLAGMMEDEGFRGLVSGEVKPTLRQVYEMMRPQVLVEAQVQTKVSESLAAVVDAAVSEAVAMAEKNLCNHIQARGMRPRESGSNAASGVRTHPAVHRLTREDRAKLAQMAQRGENVRL